MEAIAGLALRIIEAAGPPAAILAGLIVSLGVLVILLAQFGGIYDRHRTEAQKTDFQGLLVQLVDRLTKSEEALRADADRIEAENNALRDRQRELLTTIELLRNQLRRYIELLRAVHEGRLAPSSIDPAELVEILGGAA